jgi:uncharacterized membrane protein
MEDNNTDVTGPTNPLGTVGDGGSPVPSVPKDTDTQDTRGHTFVFIVSALIVLCLGIGILLNCLRLLRLAVLGTF